MVSNSPQAEAMKGVLENGEDVIMDDAPGVTHEDDGTAEAKKSKKDKKDKKDKKEKKEKKRKAEADGPIVNGDGEKKKKKKKSKTMDVDSD